MSKQIKRIAFASLFCMLIFGTCIGASAADINQYSVTQYSSASASVLNGWVTSDGKIYYYENGVKKTGWAIIDGRYYHFRDTGAAEIGWWTDPDTGRTYHFRNTGAAECGWWTDSSNGKLYYFNPVGVCVQYVSQNPGTDGYVASDWGGYDSSQGCAVACVSMAQSSLGIHITPYQVIKNNGGTVTTDFPKSGSMIRPSSIDEALNNYNSNPNKYAPPIIHVIAYGSDHWVVVVGGTAGAYVTLDPGYGKNKTYAVSSSSSIIQYYK